MYKITFYEFLRICLNVKECVKEFVYSTNFMENKNESEQ